MVCERGMWEGECRYVIPIHCYSTITTRLGLGIAQRNDIKSGGGAWEADIFPSDKQKLRIKYLHTAIT